MTTTELPHNAPEAPSGEITSATPETLLGGQSEAAPTPPAVECRATYSPEDNKIRIYAEDRLPADVYSRVRDAGFRFAPAQKLFFCPSWTPEAEDLALELAGDIDPEETTLEERAEARASRFGGYSKSRSADAECAAGVVHAIGSGIPMGQPILVGHHSERRARRDAERIESAMGAAVKNWETARYWEERARGSVRHADYKSEPAVRARRIRGLESDLRRIQKRAARPAISPWGFLLKDENGVEKRAEDGTYLIDWPAVEKAKEARKTPWVVPAPVQRWISHYENRLAYERAALAADGGTVADSRTLEKGGAVERWGKWHKIQRVNTISVTVLDRHRPEAPTFSRKIDKTNISGVMTKAMVDNAREQGGLYAEDECGFKWGAPSSPREPVHKTATQVAAEQAERDMKEHLREGVKVVTARNLFPTPPHVVAQMLRLAEIELDHSVLEPSAGTGAILRGIDTPLRAATFQDARGLVVAVEINRDLCGPLAAFCDIVREGDFLSFTPETLGTFDRIVMNPPFDHGSDINHIEHARKFLKPGGRLVALCANGDAQVSEFWQFADSWTDLPDGTFKHQGTNVRVAMVVFQA